MNPTTCMTDPCDTKFLLKFKDTITDAITMIVNQSLTWGEFLYNWKDGHSKTTHQRPKPGY